jgi:creatinine amidohydrolase
MELMWNKLNWREFKQLQEAGFTNALLPVGTIEAHGITPLGTDNIIPEGIAQNIAPDVRALIAPTVSYGITRSLISYSGSLTVSSRAFQDYVTEILISMAGQGMRKVIVLNGHGGQMEELRLAAFSAFQKSGLKVAVIHWWIMCESLVEKYFGTAGGHAAVDETAAVMANAPDTIKKELYDPAMLYHVKPGINLYPSPSTILIYKENTGSLNFDQKRAGDYFQAVCGMVKEFVLDLFYRWDN